MRALVFLFLALPLQSLRQARYAVTNFVLGRSRIGDEFLQLRQEQCSGFGLTG